MYPNAYQLPATCGPRPRPVAVVPELGAFPAPGVFDGELIAFVDGKPEFLALTDRMLLTRDASIPIALVVFDLHAVWTVEAE